MGACSAKMEAKFKMEGLLEIDDIRTVFTDIHLVNHENSGNSIKSANIHNQKISN